MTDRCRQGWLLVLLVAIASVSCEQDDRCDTQSNTSRDYFIEFSNGTTLERVAEIAQLVGAEIINRPVDGFSLSYVFRLAHSDGITSDKSRLSQFSDVKVVIWDHPLCAH